MHKICQKYLCFTATHFVVTAFWSSTSLKENMISVNISLIEKVKPSNVEGFPLDTVRKETFT